MSLCLIGMVQQKVSAQPTYITVDDAILKNFLETNYPYIFEEDGRINRQTAEDSINYTFDISNLGVVNVRPTQYFWRIDQLLMSHNNIVFMPSLAKYKSIDTLDFSYNQITKFPELIGHSETMRLVFEHNLIDTLTDSVTQKPDFLNTVLGAHNELQYLPKFDHMINLVEVDFTYNRLSFVDMIPLSNHPNFSSVFKLMPQKPFGTEQTISIDEGDDITLSQVIQETDTNDIFTWYKDGLEIQQSVELSISNAKKSDAGQYVLVVTNGNSEMTGLSLSSDTITLKVKTPILPDTTCFTNANLLYETTIIDCQTPIKLTIDKSTFKDYTFPLAFTLTNLATGQIQTLQTPSFENVGEGNFSLEVEDGKKCKLSYPNFVTITKKGICDPVISPNGDGIADTWFFDYSGTIKIFNSRGTLIKTLQGPTSWNGTDENGTTVSPDYYSVISDNRSLFHLTVIY